mmetsp:Transcript_82218/g.129444  ORF Transcript_82218/g.129444 Transcript_82218/m.129444 type:complete len:106 (-) Transcript_82218:51-368(-)
MPLDCLNVLRIGLVLGTCLAPNHRSRRCKTCMGNRIQHLFLAWWIHHVFYQLALKDIQQVVALRVSMHGRPVAVRKDLIAVTATCVCGLVLLCETRDSTGEARVC